MNTSSRAPIAFKNIVVNEEESKKGVGKSQCGAAVRSFSKACHVIHSFPTSEVPTMSNKFHKIVNKFIR
jgi:hypothetical protein